MAVAPRRRINVTSLDAGKEIRTAIQTVKNHPQQRRIPQPGIDPSELSTTSNNGRPPRLRRQGRPREEEQRDQRRDRGQTAEIYGERAVKPERARFIAKEEIQKYCCGDQ
jgi:hypothetical protein